LIVNATNEGFARGMNVGIQSATAPLILTLNADTELLRDTLPPLLQAIFQLPRAGILGPVQYLPSGNQPGEPGLQLASAFPDPTLVYEAWRLLSLGDSLAARLRLGPWQRTQAGPPRQVAWVMGAALLFRRECLDDVKGFDATEFMYGEDWDICYRARKAGWQVYLVPESRIIHHENAAGRQQFGPGRKARVLQARLYFHGKHFGRTSRRALAYLYVIGAALRLALLAPDRLVGRARSDPQMRWHAPVGRSTGSLARDPSLIARVHHAYPLCGPVVHHKRKPQEIGSSGTVSRV